jgi:hypothetical protein
MYLICAILLNVAKEMINDGKTSRDVTPLTDGKMTGLARVTGGAMEEGFRSVTG